MKEENGTDIKTRQYISVLYYIMYLNNINKVVDTVCTFCLSLLFGLQYSDLNVAD